MDTTGSISDAGKSTQHSSKSNEVRDRTEPKEEQEEPKNWRLGPKRPTNEERIQRMKQMLKQVMDLDDNKEKRRRIFEEAESD